MKEEPEDWSIRRMQQVEKEPEKFTEYKVDGSTLYRKYTAHPLASQSHVRRRPWKPSIGERVYRRIRVQSSAGNYYTEKLAPRYEGPFEVVKFISPVIVLLRTVTANNNKVKNKQLIRCHIRDIKGTHNTEQGINQQSVTAACRAKTMAGSNPMVRQPTRPKRLGVSPRRPIDLEENYQRRPERPIIITNIPLPSLTKPKDEPTRTIRLKTASSQARTNVTQKRATAEQPPVTTTMDMQYKERPPTPEIPKTIYATSKASSIMRMTEAAEETHEPKKKKGRPADPFADIRIKEHRRYHPQHRRQKLVFKRRWGCVTAVIRKPGEAELTCEGQRKMHSFRRESSRLRKRRVL